jgi:hypothetical protein
MGRSLPPVKDGAVAIAAQLCAAGRFQISGHGCRAEKHEQSARFSAHRSPPGELRQSMHLSFMLAMGIIEHFQQLERRL